MNLCNKCLIYGRAQNKQYRETHKDKLAESKREYSQQHKERLKSYRRTDQYIEYYCPVCLYTDKFDTTTTVYMFNT